MQAGQLLSSALCVGESSLWGPDLLLAPPHTHGKAPCHTVPPHRRAPCHTVPTPQEGPVSYPKLHLPLWKLQTLFQQQLRVEMATTVTVQSVEKAQLLTKEVLDAVRSSAESQPPGVGRAVGPGQPVGRPPPRGECAVGHVAREDPSSGVSPPPPLPPPPEAVTPVSAPPPQRRTLKQLRTAWVEALCAGLRDVKASEARAARSGRPTLFPYLCLLTERELARLLLQVGRRRAGGGWGGWRRWPGSAHLTVPPPDPAGAAAAGRVPPLPGAAAGPARLQPARGAEEAAQPGAGAATTLLPVPAPAGLGHPGEARGGAGLGHPGEAREGGGPRTPR